MEHHRESDEKKYRNTRYVEQTEDLMRKDIVIPVMWNISDNVMRKEIVTPVMWNTTDNLMRKDIVIPVM